MLTLKTFSFVVVLEKPPLLFLHPPPSNMIYFSSSCNFLIFLLCSRICEQILSLSYTGNDIERSASCTQEANTSLHYERRESCG